MTTTIHVPYVDYEIESVRTALGTIYRTANAIENAAEDLRDHWEELPAYLSGSPVTTTGYYASMKSRTVNADRLAEMLRAIWDALDDYADQAPTPLTNLKRLQEEAVAWQARKPLTVMSAPGTPPQDLWAAQAGYAPGSVCLAESPWTTWNNDKARIEAEVAKWAREYERIADECSATLRRIKDPSLMAWWDAIGGSNPSRKPPIFNYGDNTRRNFAPDGNGFNDGYYTIKNGTYHSGADGWRYEDHGEKEHEGKGRSDYFGYGVEGVNVSDTWHMGAHGESQGSFGEADGFNGGYSASATAGLYARGSAGVNYGDGKLTAGASGDAVAGVRADASGSVEYGLLNASGKADAAAGAIASGRANLTAGADGVKANLGGELFAGAQASAGANVGVSGVTAGVGVTGYAGIGVKGDVDFAFAADSVKVDVDVGAALGLGAGVKFSVNISPKKIVEDIGDLFGF